MGIGLEALRAAVAVMADGALIADTRSGAVFVNRAAREMLDIPLDLEIDTNYLKDIVGAFHTLADESSGRIRAQVTVASPLSEPELARLRTVLGKMTNRQVVIEPKEDPRLIGGVVTRIGGKVYDGSIRAQLEVLHTRLRQANL